jgi:hypothetical protein
MKVLLCGLALFAAFLPTKLTAQTFQPDQIVNFSDGSKASTYGHCGDTDLCALIVYANGDRLSVFSEGAAYCQPYMLHFVKVNGTTTIFEYSRTINHDVPTSSAFGVRCGNSQATQMVMDHGLIHMTVTENHDGTLSIVFTPTEQGAERQQGQDTPTPSPGP